MNYEQAFKEFEEFLANEYNFHTQYGDLMEVTFLESFAIEMHRLKTKWHLISASKIVQNQLLFKE